VVVALAHCSGALAQQGQPVTNEEIVKELQALKRAVEGLADRVEKLEARLQEQQEEREAGLAWPGSVRSERKGADLKALRKIRLAADATKEQVRDYVHQILDVSRGQIRFISTDPQAGMLARVGPEHLDVLLEAATIGYRGDMYVRQAIVRLARDEHKAMILEALPYDMELVEVVLRKRWEQDAKETLVAELRSAPSHVPTGWIRAVARLKDPDTYDDLKRYLIHGHNRSWTYNAIRNLPGIDLAETVAEAWEWARDDPYDDSQMASVALAFGHIDALELVMDSLDLPSDTPGTIYQARQLALRHTEARGTNEELRRWFQQNKHRLVFDPEARKFRVRKDE
ncbi:MAG: hypothetical protein KAX80_15695, partial [Planctomycetes bacterium]|nr:hypothetical protein [Planctomycetota bacterium]